VLCLLHPDGAREVVVAGADLDAALNQVRTLAAAERDDPSPLPEMRLVDA
jgi:hypothetical protein